MDKTKLGSVTVTYHPDAEVLENLRRLGKQIATMVVVDNGSDESELAALRESSRGGAYSLLENGENLGIAAALNHGIRHLLSAGCEYVFLFDQDSAITDGYVETMRSCAATHPLKERLAILVPRYVDSRFGSVLAPPMLGDTLEAATTSGSLMPARIFDSAGMFAEELFIDGVDYEYSLRVRALGWIIAECPAATLLHSPGTPTYHRLLGGKPFQAANYSPVRRYFQERNKIWVARRYWRQFRAFCLGQFAISVKDLIKILLVEQEKAVKVRYFLRGIGDGLRERMGPFPGTRRNK